MFFSFEGIDGSGKSTQAQRLASALRAQAYEVVEVREPGGTVLGESIRSLLLNPSSRMDPRAELLLFSAARAQLVAEVIQPALAREAVVIADRFFDSSSAYQGGGRELMDLASMTSLHEFATAGVKPDRTYWIDIDLETAAHRRGDRDADRMEQSGDAFYQRVTEAYLRLSTLAPERIVRLDGSLGVNAQHDAILSDALAVLS